MFLDSVFGMLAFRPDDGAITLKFKFVQRRVPFMGIRHTVFEIFCSNPQGGTKGQFRGSAKLLTSMV